MKKALFITIFTVLAVSSSIKADQLSNRSIFIEGTSIRPDHLEYFLVNFRKEALGTGTVLADTSENAAFIFKFDVSSNPYIEEDGNAFLLTISLINNFNNDEILIFHFYYNSLDEMYEHNHYLFYRAVAVIPPLTEEALLRAQSAWKNKWIYVRASFDCPITLYALQPDGLVAGLGIYEGSFDDPLRVSDLDNKIIALPGITIGAEFQFLDFLSFELNFMANLGDFNSNSFINLGINTQLKYSIKKFNRFVIQPYLAGYIPFTKSNDFWSIPPFAFGGGIQLSTRGGSNGAFFVDLSYLTTFTDAVGKNFYGDLFPYPKEIKYKQSFIKLSVGYKYGFIDRPANSAVETFLCDCGHHHEIPGIHNDPVRERPQCTPRERKERTPSKGTFYF